MKIDLGSGTALLRRASLALALLWPLAPSLTGIRSPPATSVAASRCTHDNPLGLAGGFTEFIHHDAQRVSDSEGMVAYGGDATLGDAGQKVGFSVGSGRPVDSVGPDLPADPAVHRLIVGGAVDATQLVVLGGAARVGSYAPGSQSIDAAGPVTEGPPTVSSTSATTIDFDAEFAELAAKSRLWDELATTGTVSSVGGELTLQGDEPELNVFHLTREQFESASSIRIRVPAGSSILVDVAGADLSMVADPLSTISLWDPGTGQYLVDDHFINGMPIPSTDWLRLRQSLLWNFPDATHILKDYVSWPGTILAPHAAFEFGRGTEVGPGHVDGQLIASSVTSAIGAETHHLPLVSTCLPKADAALGSLQVVKRVDGAASDAAQTFAVRVDCDGSTYDEELHLTVPAGRTDATYPIPDLPVGLRCLVTEPDVPEGWRLVGVDPEQVTVADGQVATVTVTNARLPGPTPTAHPTGPTPTHSIGATPTPEATTTQPGVPGPTHPGPGPRGPLPDTGLGRTAIPLLVGGILSVGLGIALVRRARAR